jgi:hypothetical protein
MPKSALDIDFGKKACFQFEVSGYLLNFSAAIVEPTCIGLYRSPSDYVSAHVSEAQTSQRNYYETILKYSKVVLYVVLYLSNKRNLIDMSTCFNDGQTTDGKTSRGANVIEPVMRSTCEQSATSADS